MIQKSDSFDLLKITGLGPKKKSPRDRYAALNRRMLAALIDIMLIAPITEFISRHTLGPAPLNQLALAQQMEAEGITPDAHGALPAIWHALGESGYFNWWLANNLLIMAVFAVGSAICWHFWGATPGKILLRMKVVDVKSETQPSTKQIILRILGYFPSALILFIGFFWIGFDRKRQGWHDKLAGTVVLTLPWRKKTTPGSQAADRSDSPAP